jgi:hypothetical protein
MGIDYRAAVVVGLPREQVESNGKFDDERDDFQDWAEEHGMEFVAPYYDGYDDALVGYVYRISPDYGRSIVRWAPDEVEELKATFREVVGKDAEVYLSVLGY